MHYIFLIHGIGDGTPSEDFSKFEDSLAAKYRKQRKLDIDSWNKRLQVVPVLWDEATAKAELSIFQLSFDRGVKSLIELWWVEPTFLRLLLDCLVPVPGVTS